jgi:hypothetical protein
MPKKHGCPILAVILSDHLPPRRKMGVEGPASWKSGEGWDSTNASSRALYQGMASAMPKITRKIMGLQPLIFSAFS